MKKLTKLYKKIPKFTCIEGCTDCCGPVPWSKSEWEAIKDKRSAVGINCPYANNGCDIYDQRPFMCRLFGASDHPLLTCHRGCGPEKKLSDHETRRLTSQYKDIFGE